MCFKCQMILLPLSRDCEWKFALTEWELLKTKQHNTACKRCICGESIKNVFYLCNTITGHTRKLGCVCIINVFEDNKKLVDDVLKYTCVICDKKLLKTSKESHEMSNKHIDNENEIKLEEELHKKYKICNTCNDYKILRSEAHYKPQCIDCFRSSNGLKKCLLCPNSIKKTFKICFKCNNKK